MELTKKQAEFWAFVLALMIIVAIAVLLLDFGIKTTILDESLKLRHLIEQERNGQRSDRADENGVFRDASVNGHVPSDVLVDNSARMETRNDPDGAETTIPDTTGQWVESQ